MLTLITTSDAELSGVLMNFASQPYHASCATKGWNFRHYSCLRQGGTSSRHRAIWVEPPDLFAFAEDLGFLSLHVVHQLPFTYYLVILGHFLISPLLPISLLPTPS
jgi:hypothetical protein